MAATIGRFGLFVEVLSPSLQALGETIDQHIAALDGVTQVSVLPAMSIYHHKAVYLESGEELSVKEFGTTPSTRDFRLDETTIEPKFSSRPVAELISNISAVTYTVICAGEFNLLCEVTCQTTAEFQDVMDELRAVDGIATTEAFVYTDLHYRRTPPRPSDNVSSTQM